MTTAKASIFSTLLSILCALPLTLEAQTPAHSFAELQSRLKRDDKLRLLGPAGTEIEGRLDTLSNTSVTLNIDNNFRTFRQADVSRILRLHHPSRLKSAIFGIVGGNVAMSIICRGRSENCSAAPGVVLAIGSGAGAVAGIGIAKLLTHTETVFESTSAVSFRFAPVMDRTHRGASVAISF